MLQQILIFFWPFNKSNILMISILAFIINWPVLAQEISQSKILLTFSEPISRETIFDPENYKVTANNNVSVRILKVGLVEGDSSVVLFFNKNDDWLSFKISVRNLRDKAGNLINEEKNGADINSVHTKNTPIKDAK